MQHPDIIALPIHNAHLIQTHPFEDHRGYVCRIIDSAIFHLIGIDCTMNQVNYTISPKKGTLRGLHYQSSPFDETKAIQCTKGQIFDVFIDMKPNSPTFRQWHSETLSESDHKTLIIPKGCAHGFLTLSNDTQIIYTSSNSHESKSECGVRYNDPAFKINWPIPIMHLSDKDKNWPLL